MSVSRSPARHIGPGTAPPPRPIAQPGRVLDSGAKHPGRSGRRRARGCGFGRVVVVDRILTHGDLDTIIREDERRVGRSQLCVGHFDGCVGCRVHKSRDPELAVFCRGNVETAGVLEMSRGKFNYLWAFETCRLPYSRGSWRRLPGLGTFNPKSRWGSGGCPAGGAWDPTSSGRAGGKREGNK